MKYLIIVILLLSVLSCTVDPVIQTEIIYIENPIPPAESELIGIWERNSLAWDFYADGEFIYYDSQTLQVINYGFYLDDPEQGVFYVEDYATGAYMYYFYQLIVNYPVLGDITLSMSPEIAPGNITEWLKFGQ